MDASAIFALIGSIAILAGLIGGGIEAKEIKIPQLPRWSRVLSGITGVVLLGLSVWLARENGDTKGTETPFPTITPVAHEVSSVTPTSLERLDVYVEKIDGCTVTINGFLQLVPGNKLMWRWGDGIISEGNFPQVHSYTRSGDFTLNVTGMNGLARSVTYHIDCSFPDGTRVATIEETITQIPDQEKLYSIRSLYSSMVLDVSNSSKDYNINIIQSPWTGTASQIWKFKPLKDEDMGYFQIVNVNSEMCVDVFEGSRENGAVVNQYICTQFDNQKIRIVPVGNREVVFIIKHSGKAFDMGSLEPLSALKQWGIDESVNQEFQLVEIEP